jgi:hypothetical protein
MQYPASTHQSVVAYRPPNSHAFPYYPSEVLIDVQADWAALSLPCLCERLDTARAESAKENEYSMYYDLGS